VGTAPNKIHRRGAKSPGSATVDGLLVSASVVASSSLARNNVAAAVELMPLPPEAEKAASSSASVMFETEGCTGVPLMQVPMGAAAEGIAKVVLAQ
jgi:hypothetical protein